MSAAEPVRAPRYVSAAELAARTGLSVKTVRRRVKDGTFRAWRVGRRVLIPFPVPGPGTPEAPTMAIAPTSARPTVDPDTGRLLPLTAEQRRARSEALARALDEIDGITDATDTDERWADVMRGIDEARPHRPLFEGSY